MKCFIDTVSPARNNARSSTLWYSVGGHSPPVRNAKSYGRMPSFHDDSAKLKSSAVRALTINGVEYPHESFPCGAPNDSSTEAMPSRSVRPCQRSVPVQ